MNSTRWQISADTGGTFTDCFGVPPGAAAATEARLVKVLSSGKLRIAVAERTGDRQFRLEPPSGWSAPDGFFREFAAETGSRRASVTEWDSAARLMTLDTSIPGTPGSIDLSTGEEAPVIGARLLTGTGLKEPFPSIDFRLGTTRGTNALLERKGAPVAFFVTRGFGDLLEIRDQRRPDLFALEHRKPRPLYQAVVEIEERIAADGSVLAPLGSRFESEAKALLERGIRIAAVALLHSYLNPAHERRLRDRLTALGFDHVSLSSELAPFIKIVPRAETAVVDATLTPILETFIDHVADRIGRGSHLVMTSSGGLEPTADFRPKDSLLSGPAGGVVGAVTAARALGFDQVITFDMGGTSTDVARFDGDFLYRFEQSVGDATLLSPSLKIETVAAGGGSICRWTEAGLRVGPESAGADPGPACYGRGGPLTITDVNLLLGRIDPENFGIPIGRENIEAAKRALVELVKEAGSEERGARAPEIGSAHYNPFSLLDSHFSLLIGVAEIATEQMADAIRTISIRDGADPTAYTLVAFGGAGPLHACAIAERLGIRRILVPAEAGLLSAYGIHHASVERFAERQVLDELGTTIESLPRWLEELAEGACDRLESDLGGNPDLVIRRRIAEIRMKGQDSALTVEIGEPDRLADQFRQKYRAVFGYEVPANREIELVSIRVIAATTAGTPPRIDPIETATPPSSIENSRFVDRGRLEIGATVAGPAVIQDPFSTLYLEDGWKAVVVGNRSLVVSLQRGFRSRSRATAGGNTAVTRELFRHRFENLVGEMGAMLQSSAISTNVKERADFSCALLDADGELVVNAPHIPVHLGALGLCVREVARSVRMRSGDVVVTNHPAFGGSHLPDVTLITPVFTKFGETLVGYVANRAHHAEIGGLSPGSMPADARNLAEEGVVISPAFLLRENDSTGLDNLRKLLSAGPHPSRNVPDNLADISAQIAANHRGAVILSELAGAHGENEIRDHLESLASQSRRALSRRLRETGFSGGETIEKLDDGAEIRCRIEAIPDNRLAIDFTGTAASHPGNLHATPAIVRSAVLYVLRLWTQSALPLNEGLLRNVEIILPRCFLNPDFSDDPDACPAVVGGNVETSQRLVDALVRAFGFQAGSQGTMNNFIFGDDSFGYYETIGGGAGAGPDYDGADGLHTHMTNTAITDPEILEHRYPVILRRFSIRENSGGAGRHRGGHGLIRELEFREPLQISLLTQHRVEAPFGLDGGKPGKPGRQILKRNGEENDLPGVTSFDARPGDVLRIETPGGGGWGPPS